VIGRVDDVEDLDESLAGARPGHGRPQPADPRRDGVDLTEQTAASAAAN